MSFLRSVRLRAAAARRRIVFPESADERTLEAVRALAADDIVTPILVLDPLAPDSWDATLRTGVRVVDPMDHPHREKIVNALQAGRGRRRISDHAADLLSRQPLYAADGLVALDEADGCVAGAAHTTADVLRAALRSVGAAPGVSTVSSAFYMVVGNFRGADEEVLTFTDCAVVREPSEEQLADIAIAAAEDRRAIVEDEPRVAFLSFSTRRSGNGSSVQRVQDAVELVRRRAPDLAVDGELQGDAALIEAVARRKTDGGPVAGRANVLVFPSLDAANIAYKLVERLARAHAIGPIVQGLARPCNDLSRGASIDDIINVAAITALQAVGAGRSA